MINALLRWIFTMLAVALAAYLLEGITYQSLQALAFAALVLGILNVVLRPVLLILSLPFIIVTLGLFLLVINALTLWLTGFLVPGFDVQGFWTAVLGGLIISLVNLFTGEKKSRSRLEARLTGRKRKDKRRPGPPPGKGPVIDI